VLILGYAGYTLSFVAYFADGAAVFVDRSLQTVGNAVVGRCAESPESDPAVWPGFCKQLCGVLDIVFLCIELQFKAFNGFK
jgi:hypothetical protein